jgi:thymidylate synthase
MSYQERLEKKTFVVGKELLRSGEIPSVMVVGETLPEAWETAFLAVWEYGALIPAQSQFDQASSPDSRDTSMTIVVTSPFKEPRIHLKVPYGTHYFKTYKQIILEGSRDAYVDQGEGYTYHDRLKHWPGVDGWQKIEELVGQEIELPYVDQVEAMVSDLVKVPYTRRAQAITWNPLRDAHHGEPPCLQRVWCRIVESETGIYLLEMNTHWRSRDAFNAAFYNMYGLTELQKKMAEEVAVLSGKKVEVGRYIDISDSFHIYGHDIEQGKIEEFLNQIETMSFEQRVWRSDDSRIKFMDDYFDKLEAQKKRQE